MRSAGRACLLIPALLLSAGSPVLAAELTGNARVYGGTTKSEDREDKVRFQDYNLGVVQRVSPWVSLFFRFHHREFKVRPEDDVAFERKSSEPFFQLSYARGGFSALLGLLDRRSRGTRELDKLDVRSVFGQLNWDPGKGPRYTFRWRKESNVADVAVFGRDVDSRNLDFNAAWERGTWRARYGFERSEIDNNLSGFGLDLDRHVLAASYDDWRWDDRVHLSADALVARSTQDERIAGDAGVAEPLSARQGLFALDTTPDLGELDPVPGLIDGDAEGPTVPRIEIGGANTFRNVGLDLGVTRQATRLEVTVDVNSDSGLVWDVYSSSDNLNWQRVTGAVSSFDGAFLRYTIRFPETTDRFFKAVNVSANSIADVAVTEIRALLDVERLGGQERRSTTSRATVAAGFFPSERVSGTFSLTYDDDTGSVAGLPVRDSRQISYESLVRVSLNDDLIARLQYLFSDLRRNQAPVLRRNERRVTASLFWTPLPTVDGVFSASRREEHEAGRLIRASDTVRARALTELLPELRLSNEIAYNRVDDPFADFELSSWRWAETLESRPAERWTLSGGFSVAWFDATGSVSLNRRISADVRTRWVVAPYLTAAGSVSLGDEDGRETVSQRYSVNWAPGPKLSASVSYVKSDSLDQVVTSGTSANLGYRLNRMLAFFSSFSRSAQDRVSEASSRVTSLTFGFTLAF